MSKTSVIDTVEGSKIWGYVALGTVLLAVTALAITFKEVYEAKKTANNLAIAEAELEAVNNDSSSSREVVAEESEEGGNMSTEPVPNEDGRFERGWFL